MEVVQRGNIEMINWFCSAQQDMRRGFLTALEITNDRWMLKSQMSGMKMEVLWISYIQFGYHCQEMRETSRRLTFVLSICATPLDVQGGYSIESSSLLLGNFYRNLSSIQNSMSGSWLFLIFDFLGKYIFWAAAFLPENKNNTFKDTKGARDLFWRCGCTFIQYPNIESSIDNYNYCNRICPINI